MMKEAGHTFLARMGKTKLRPGGIDATNWLLDQAPFTKDSKVLEVACNMGTTMIMVAERFGCQVTGIDLDEKALAQARENIAAHHLEDKLTVQQANAFALPFADNSFDIVINEAMLTMLIGENKDKALKEYARVLKPGGVLLTQDVCLKTDDPATQKELLAGLSRVINVHVEPLTLHGWKERIEKYGFTTKQKSDKMTLMAPLGMIHDEGMQRTLKIMTNGAKEENIQMFSQMFTYFNAHQSDLAYVANYSVKN